MLTTIRVRGNFSPPRTLTAVANSSVEFWDMIRQIGRPTATREVAFTRQFDRVAVISHEGDVGARKDWRPHGSHFVRIVGGVDDKLWTSADKPGVTANIAVSGCTEDDCADEYDAGLTAGTTYTRQRYVAWAGEMPAEGSPGTGGEIVGATANVTSVASSATSVQLLAANAARLSFRIQNESNQILYVKYGTAASITSYTVQVAPGGWVAEDGYSGILHGIWAGANGNARVTEILP